MRNCHAGLDASGVTFAVYQKPLDFGTTSLNGCITTWNIACVFLPSRLINNERSARVNEIVE